LVHTTIALILSLACTSTQLPNTSATADERWRQARSQMVEDQLRGRDIRSEKVLEAIAVPVGTDEQELRVMRRTAEGLAIVRTLPVRFVPMTGKPGGPR